jgi:hypothetical protein
MYPRRARKVDKAQREVIDALERVGVQVWVIQEPCDLLTLCRGIWLPLEVKTPGVYVDKRQLRQQEFLKSTGTPIVKSATQAVEVVIDHSRRIYR